MENANFNITSNPGDIKRTTTDYTINGKCSHCGGCCPDHLMTTEDEIAKIRKYIEANNIKPVMHTSVLATNSVDLLCPFVNMAKPTEKCIIYDVRPAICKCYSCHYKIDDNTDISNPAIKEMIDMVKSKKTKTINLRQTFYPEMFMPKKNDIVVVTTLDPTFYDEYKGIPFVVEEINKQNGINFIKMYMGNKPSIQITCNAACVTKVINPVVQRR